MPKIKTKSAAKKRFTLTGTGKIKCQKLKLSPLQRSVSRLLEQARSSVSTLITVTF